MVETDKHTTVCPVVIELLKNTVDNWIETDRGTIFRQDFS